MSIPVVLFAQEFVAWDYLIILPLSSWVLSWVLFLCVVKWGSGKHSFVSHTGDTNPAESVSGLAAYWTLPAIWASILFFSLLIGCEGLHSPRFIGMEDSKYLSPSCSEGPQRPELLPECSCGPALPFFPGVLRACRTSSFQETLAGTLGLSSKRAQSLMQHRGKRVPHSSVYLDPGPSSLPPRHTQFPTSTAAYLRRSNLLELSWEGGWDSFSLQNSQNPPPSPAHPPLSNIGRVFSCLILMIILWEKYVYHH